MILNKKEKLQIATRTSERMMAVQEAGKLTPHMHSQIEAVIYNGLCQLYHDCKKKKFYSIKAKLKKKLIQSQILKKASTKKQYKEIYGGDGL